MDIETVVSLIVLVTTIVGSHALLRRELKADLERIEGRVDKLDDRVYQLAAGLKPLVEQAERQA